MDEIKQFLKTRKKANLTIVMINIVVFVVLSIMGDTTDGQFMVDHGAAFTPYILAGTTTVCLPVCFCISD